MSKAAWAAPVDTKEVDRRLTMLMKKPGMVGLAVAVVENGELTFSKGYGLTQKGTKDPVTPNTVFRWASISKSLAAATVLTVSREGHFGLNSPVIAHAPSLKLPKATRTTTIEDILSHQTGIKRSARDRWIEAGKPAKLSRTALKDIKRVCEPRLCHTYQNVAFDAVAEMIETAKRLPYKAVVSETLFKPLEMETASLTREGLFRSESWAKPHNNSGRAIAIVKPTYYRVPAAAGVNSSVKDLAKWMQAQMPGTPYSLSPDIRKLMQNGLVDTPREDQLMQRAYHAMGQAKYGLGWRIYDYEGHRVIGHRGAVQGYRSLVLFDPELRTGIALLWNSTSGYPIGLQLEVMDQVYGRPRRDWMRLGR